MIELPEALTLSRQLAESVGGKIVKRVYPPSSPHKFCWFHGDPEDYHQVLCGHQLQAVQGFGIFVEMIFDGGIKLNVNDGVNLRLQPAEETLPAKYQLLIEFIDGSRLVFTVAMYGGIICYQDNFDNEYYVKSKSSISPLSSEYDEKCFNILVESAKPTLSAKALLATEQRIPGIGNGSVQDILFTAGIHPKRKVKTFSEADRKNLFQAVKKVLQQMVEQGGRDTEKDLYGKAGGYQTRMSKNALAAGCCKCGGTITKEAYLGGTVYYCPVCQPLITT